MTSFGGTIKLTGESDYRRAIQSITQDLGKMSTALKQQTSAFTSSDKSVSTAAQKQKALTQSLAEQKSKLADAKTALAQYSVALQAQQTRHQSLTREYKNAVKELDRIKAESGETSEEYKKQAQVVDKLGEELADSTAEMNESKSAMSALKTEINTAQKTISETEKELEELGKELDDDAKEMEKAGKSSKDFDKALDDVADSAGGAEKGIGVFGVALGNLAANAIQKVITGLKDIIAGTIETGQTFDTSMSNVQALSGATADEMAMLRDTAKDFGSTTQFSASQAADALGYMALAGWDANTSAGALGGVLDLAAASGMDLAQASDMVTDYMSAFNMEAQDSAYFADLLAYAQANANTNVEQLGEAFKNSAANMNAAGQDVETTTALLAMMANQGYKGSEAGTALTAVMRDMTAKMKDGKIAIGETSVEVMDANGNYRDMTDILKDVESATNGMGDAEKAAALSSSFTADSIKGLNLILNAGVDEAAKFEEELRNSGGTAKETAAVMNDNLGGDLTSLGSKVEGVQIALYEKFEPALRSATSVLSSMADGVQWLIDHSGEVIAVLTGLAAGVGAYVAYTAALTVMKEGWKALIVVQKAVEISQMALNVVMAMNPIGIVIAAIVALVAAFVVLWNKSDSFRNFWVGLWDNIKEVAQKVVEAVTKFFSEAWDNIKKVWDTAKSFYQGVWNGITEVFSNVGEWFRSKFNEAWTHVKNIWNGAKSFFSGIWNNITGVFSNVSGWFRDKFTAAWQAVKNVFSGWGSFFGGLWDTIKNKFSSIGTSIASAISGAVRIGINGIISRIEGTINSAIGIINGAIGLINKLPGVSVGTVGRVSFPRLARGGIVDRPTFAQIGEDGAEAVIPLENNTQWIRKVAGELGAQLTANQNKLAKQQENTLSYDKMVNGLKDALYQVKIELDDDEVGRFVDRTVTRLVYN